MSSSRKSPAIFAGLTGIGAFAVPVPSYALDLPSNLELPSSLHLEAPFTFEEFAASPAVYFVLGCLAGACVSGLIVYVVQKHKQKVLRERFTNELNEARAAQQTSQPQAASPVAQKAGQPFVAAEPFASEPETTPSGEPAGATQQTTPLTFTNPYSTGTLGSGTGAFTLPTPVEADASSSFVSAKLDALLPHVSSGAFFSNDDALESTAGGGATNAVAKTVAGEQAAVQDSSQAEPSERAMQKPSSEFSSLPNPATSTATPASSTFQPTHTSEITTTYAERQANRKRGVFSLLSERLGSNMMNDIPVIERADGTVGDIGTSWWSDTMGNTMTQLSSSDDSRALGLRPADETTDLEAAAALSANARRRQRANDLANRLPGFDTPLYPEASAPALQGASADSTAEEGDLFEEAMRNMEDELPNVGITTSSDVEATNVVPPEALGNFQNTTTVAPASAEDAQADTSFEDMPTAELGQVSGEAANDPELRRKSWHVVAGGVVDAPQPASEEAPASHGAYRPKHMRRKQA